MNYPAIKKYRKDNYADKETDRIEDIPKGEEWTKPCLHPSHNPPMHIVIPAGKRLRHVCPGCGAVMYVYGSDIHW